MAFQDHNNGQGVTYISCGQLQSLEKWYKTEVPSQVPLAFPRFISENLHNNLFLKIPFEESDTFYATS